MMRIRFGLTLKITVQTNSYPIHLPYPHPYISFRGMCPFKNPNSSYTLCIIEVMNIASIFVIAQYCRPKSLRDAPK